MLLVILPFFLSVFLLGVAAFYARKMRKVYRHLPTSNVKNCPICGEQVARRRFTRILFLFPYTFKTLRHYEKRHEDISNYARRTRLAFTLFLLLAIHSFAAAVASRGIDRVLNPAMPLLEVVPYLLVPYFSIQLIVWSIFAYLLLFKKGTILERK